MSELYSLYTIARGACTLAGKVMVGVGALAQSAKAHESATTDSWDETSFATEAKELTDAATGLRPALGVLETLREPLGSASLTIMELAEDARNVKVVQDELGKVHDFFERAVNLDPCVEKALIAYRDTVDRVFDGENLTARRQYYDTVDETILNLRAMQFNADAVVGACKVPAGKVEAFLRHRAGGS